MTPRPDEVWQFWINVGGTFTDCIARRPDGRLLRHKVLSSGVTKGVVGPGPARDGINDPARRADPEGFWARYRLRLLDQQGASLAEIGVAVSESTNGRLLMAQALPQTPEIGQPYELVSDEEAPIQAIRYLLGLGRSGCRSHPHDEYPGNRSRDARTTLSRPALGVLHPARHGRRRPASWRPRRGPADGVPRCLGRFLAFATPRAVSALWPCRRSPEPRGRTRCGVPAAPWKSFRAPSP